MGNLVDIVTAMAFGVFTHQGVVIQVPQDFPSVQEAVHAASDGDLVLVDQGVFDGGIDLLGKAVTIEGIHGAEFTAIYGGSPVFRCVSSENSNTVLRGLTIVGGRGPIGDDGVSRGGGLWIKGASPRIEQCLIVGNTAELAAAAFVDEGAPVFMDCWFHDNPSNAGGPGVMCDHSRPRFVRCGFHEDGVGWVDASPVDIRSDCEKPGGACCLGEACVQTTMLACQEARGRWHEDATCQSNVCPASCPGDVNRDRRINHTDLLAVLGGWGMCP
ncbi:MAG: hypothetical protein MK077_06535 [Phycisphaerales bacterium]|nr:hypothetical protein [Phycisphaerales bacterium]